LDDFSIAFDYEREVTAQDAEEILDKMTALHRKALQQAEATRNADRCNALRLFDVIWIRHFLRLSLTSFSKIWLELSTTQCM
jgi:hypothetical protein